VNTPTAREALLAQLAMIAGCEPSGFLEVRYRKPRGGMGQLWHPARDPRGLVAPMLELGQVTDVYVGAAPRAEQDGSKQAIAQAWAIWVDCDDAAAAERLRNFSPAPTMIVRSGSDDGVHGWWALREALRPPYIERALRRIAHHLGGDMACSDAGRIMRAVGTCNMKYGEPRPVQLERLDVDIFTAAEVVGSLPDPPGPTPAPAQPLTSAKNGPLFDLPADVYVPALTGRDVVGRKVLCPFHAGGNERTPSLHLYGTGFACFGSCEPQPGRNRFGGDIITFASKWYAIEPRGAGFHEIVARLERDLAAVLRSAA
jgi:hypothetical protein